MPSHPIRGKSGNNATNEEMTANNKKAISLGDTLMHLFPGLQVYIPGKMDEFLLRKSVYPSSIVEGLLALDCAIVGTRDLLLVYNHDGHISGGMQREIDYAIDHHKNMIMFKDIDEAVEKISITLGLVSIEKL